MQPTAAVQEDPDALKAKLEGPSWKIMGWSTPTAPQQNLPISSIGRCSSRRAKFQGGSWGCFNKYLPGIASWFGPSNCRCELLILCNLLSRSMMLDGQGYESRHNFNVAK